MCVLVFMGLGAWRFFKRATPLIVPIVRTDKEAIFPDFASLGGSCDVLVVGGTPSGAAAALAAARRGARVVLVEGRDHLGGDIVYAMLNMFDVPARPGEKAPVHGLFSEFYHQLGTAFDIEVARRMIENSVVNQPNIQVMVRTRVARIIKDGDRVIGVVLHHTPDPKSALDAAQSLQSSEKEVALSAVVDATDDASFAARAGAGYYLGRENANRDKRMQSAGLLFSVSGVDWNRVRHYVGSKRPMIAVARPKKRRRTPPSAPRASPTSTSSPTAIPAPISTALSPAITTLRSDISSSASFLAANGIGINTNSNVANRAGTSRSRNTDSSRRKRDAQARDERRRDERRRAMRNRNERNRKRRSRDVREGGAKRNGRGKIVWLRRGGVHGNYAWERGDIVRDYRPRGRDILFLSINFGRQDDGTVVLNTLNIVGVNGLDNRSRRAAMQEARRELPAFINYLRRRMPGFERARLARVAPELYIRETRHIHGFYALKVEDVRSERRFFDRVARVSYPLDLHPYVMGQSNPFGPRRYFYTLPLRCLVPRKVDGVFVASRSLSSTYSAAGSARVIPVTMAAGEASGAAAWLCWQNGITPHAMMQDSKWVSELQVSLRALGADIGDALPPFKNNLEETPSDSSRTTSKTPAPTALKTP